jgi:hypothetical protein
MMVARTLAFLMLIASLTFIADSRSNAAAPAAEKIYIVNSDQYQPDAAPGDGICATSFGNCTLGAAIQEANRDKMASKIKFASKMTIHGPTLEVLVEPFTVLDASDRWDGSWPSGRPGVIISGSLYSNGLLEIRGDYAAVYGIDFGGGGSKGIVVSYSRGTIIGGSEPGQRNAFTTSPNPNGASIGVEINNGAAKTDIRSNYFGTFDGVNAIPYPGEYGVFLSSADNTIRENIIVGHTIAGINIWLGNHNAIMDNYIGTDEIQSTALPNQVGVTLYDSDENQIGPYNVIAGNTQEGVRVQASDNNLIFGNQIGTFTLPNGGDGIHIITSSNTRVGIYLQNVVESNKGHGININSSDNTQVRLNYIYRNSKSGVYIFGSTGITIGGVAAYHKNVISKNGAQGVRLDSGADNNTSPEITSALADQAPSITATPATAYWSRTAHRTTISAD